MITSHVSVETLKYTISVKQYTKSEMNPPAYCTCAVRGRRCVCASAEVPSCEWGNQICEALEWGPPRKEGEEGEEGGRDGCDGCEGAVPKLLARKVPMKEAEELPISPLPAFPHGQREAEETWLA